MQTLNKTKSIIDILYSHVEQNPDKLLYRFLRDGETELETYSYKEFLDSTTSIATFIKQHTSAQDRVLLLFPPTNLDFIKTFLGVLHAGRISVPIQMPKPKQSIEKLTPLLKDAETTFIFTSKDCLEKIEKFDPLFQDNTITWLLIDDVEITSNESKIIPAYSESDIAFLQYTSGSTGHPKGVMITHENLIKNSQMIKTAFDYEAKDTGVFWLPPYHDMGLIGGLIQPLYGNATTTLMSPISFLQKPLRWLQAISEYKANVSGGPNFGYDLCVEKITDEEKKCLDLSHWKIACVGAEPIQAATLDNFYEAFKRCGFKREAFYPCYGLAEATLIVSGGKASACPVTKTLTTQHQDKTLIGSGEAIEDEVVKIINPKTKSECSQNETGEIWIQGTHVAKGYWKKEALTKEAFNGFTTKNEGPFFKSGDLGFIDGKEIFVTGRLKDVIIIGGAKLLSSRFGEMCRKFSYKLRVKRLRRD